jgi:hypothetical protein
LNQSFVLTPESDSGGFDESDLTIARDAFRSRRRGTTRDIHPRLLDLLYKTVRRFNAPYANVISGYRETRATSRHAQGRAIDFVLPGVSDRRLARYLRRTGFVGVGIYPNSGFVHLDVRSRSFFWVDRSWPGQRTRLQPMLRRAARRADARARASGVTPVPEVTGQPEGESPPPEDETP